MADEREQLLERARLIQQAKTLQQQKLAERQPPPEEPGALDTALEYGGKALDVGLRTLDLPGGVARVAYKGMQNIPRATAKGLESLGLESELAKKPHLVTSEDFQKALQGRAPTMAEFDVREGADPGLGTSAVGMAKDILLDPLTYATFGTSALRKGAEKTGKAIYKSGLKAVDAEAAKYGKEPVSDLLMQEGVTGSYQQIQKKMDDMAAGYLKERDEILARATRAGAEVDMGEAMAPLLAKVNEIERSGDPNLLGLAKMMKADASQYLAKGAKEPEEILRPLYKQAEYKPPYTEVGYQPPKQEIIDLPVQAEYKGPYRELPKVGRKDPGLPMGAQEPVSTELATRLREWFQRREMPDAILKGQAPLNLDEAVQMGQLMPERYIAKAPVKGFVEEPGRMIPGRSVPEEFIPRKPEIALDMTERVSGPTPIQVSGWKSSTYGKIGSPAWEAVKHTPAAKELQKAKGFGLKKATETSIEKTLGPMSKAELVELNKKLGQILTTDEKVQREALKEINKNMVSSVDAPIAVANWKAAIAKKLADMAKTTKARTKVGKGLVDKSKKSMMLERNIITSPWLEINRSRED